MWTADVAWMADAAVQPNFDLSLGGLVQFGLLGVIFVMLISKKFIVPKWSLDDRCELYERELASKAADIVELKEANARLQALTQERIIPALVEANQISTAFVRDLARSGEDSERGRTSTST